MSSDGVTDKKDFNSSMLRPPRIIFTPGGELKDTKKTLEYSRISQGMVPLRRLVALIVIARVRFNVQLVMAVRFAWPACLSILWFLGGSFR